MKPADSSVKWISFRLLLWNGKNTEYSLVLRVFTGMKWNYNRKVMSWYFDGSLYLGHIELINRISRTCALIVRIADKSFQLNWRLHFSVLHSIVSLELHYKTASDRHHKQLSQALQSRITRIPYLTHRTLVPSSISPQPVGWLWKRLDERISIQ